MLDQTTQTDNTAQAVFQATFYVGQTDKDGENLSQIQRDGLDFAIARDHTRINGWGQWFDQSSGKLYCEPSIIYVVGGITAGEAKGIAEKLKEIGNQSAVYVTLSKVDAFLI